MPTRKILQQTGHHQFDWPLIGKLRTDVDPILIGEGNFQTLVNLRYAADCPKGIKGMTRINQSALPYITLVNGFHFLKDQPSESHVFVQATSSSLSRLYKSDNTAVVPNNDTFSNVATLENNNPVFFSDAPNGAMVACNGASNRIWEGKEGRCSSFIVYDPNGTFWYDYTDKINNTLSDAANVARMPGTGGGIDANAVTVLHLDNNVTDSETSPKTFTNNNVTFDASDKVFGTHSAVFNGTNANLTAPHSADFDFSSGTFSIDLRVKVASLAAINPIFYQSIAITKISFTNGVVAPVVGATVNGQTSSATGVVDNVVVSSGAWATSDAAGTLYLSSVTGTWQDAENIRTSTTVNAVSSSVATSAGSNYMDIGIDTAGEVFLTIHECYGAGSNAVSLSTSSTPITAGIWYMVSVVENSNNYYIFVGPSSGTATLQANTTSSSRPKLYSSVISIGYDGTNYLSARIDEYRISNIARWTAAFGVPLSAYSAASSTVYIYVGSPRPIQGVKLYVGTANGNTAAATGFEWTGAAWSALTLTDGTATSGKTLAKTGSVTFSSTVLTSKLKAIKRGVAYYYQFVFTGVDAATTIYNCTLDAPMQSVTDLWDGSGRTALSCFRYTTSYTDYTTNVKPSTTSVPKAYVATDTKTYAQFGGLTSSQYIYCGFTERMLGLEISMPDALYVNTTANTVVSVDYWNGTAWTTVGAVDDSTLTGAISFNHSGLITWNPASENTEFQTNVANDYQFYYYRVHFSQTLSSDVRVDNISGITAQKEIKPYRFPVMWQNRIWLFNDETDKRNTGICSAFSTNCVFNGEDSVPVEIGDAKDLICGESIFSRYGSNIYDNLVLFKRNSMYLIDGTSPSNWLLYTVDKVGCVAPLTLKRCDVSFEVDKGFTKNVLIWRSSRGIDLFDGNTLSPISSDINNFFDPASTDYIDPTVYDVSLESGSYDESELEYHWYFTNASGKQEWVYSLLYRKWWQADRGTGKEINCGFSVKDASGNSYLLGGTSDGFIQRLEHGTTFDGNSITYKFRTGDILPAKSGSYVTKLRHVKLFARVKNISTAKVAIKHYADTAYTGTVIANISQSDALRRLYQQSSSVNFDAVLHSLEYSVTTSDEVVGFEPYLVSGLWEVVRESV